MGGSGIVGIQLIFVVETNEKSNSDYIYIKSILDAQYNGRLLNDVKFTPVYMRGKGNYNQHRVINKIKTYSKQYMSAGDTRVIYCVDTDQFDIKPEDKMIFEEIQSYCTNNEYDLVWFCHDIEEVFLGNSVPKNKKTEFANKYSAHNGVAHVDISKLKSRKKAKMKSNLIYVLNKYLEQSKEC